MARITDHDIPALTPPVTASTDRYFVHFRMPDVSRSVEIPAHWGTKHVQTLGFWLDAEFRIGQPFGTRRYWVPPHAIDYIERLPG